MKLDLFSLHYKGDETNGINLMFFGSTPQLSTLVGLTAQEALEHCKSVHNQFINDYRKAGERVLDDVQGQLDEFVIQYNTVMDKAIRVGHNEVGFKTYDVDSLLRLIIVVVMTDIYTLTTMGRIKNDEYNGLSYGYKVQ